MKKTVAFLWVSFFAFQGIVHAQQKYGHINSEEIVRAMPEFKLMTEAVEKKKKEAQDNAQRMYNDYQLKLKELNQYGASMMEAVREEKMKELDSLQHSIAGYDQTETDEIQKFQNKLLKPLNDKYLKIIGSVAKENGYTYIFDLASGAVAYHPENTGDISDLVKKKLGIN